MVASGAALQFSGGVTYSSAEPLTLAGGSIAVPAGGGSNSFAGPVTLTTATGGISVADGAALTLLGNINGARGLNVDAGSSGAMTFSGAIGNATPIASIAAAGGSLAFGAVKTTGSQSYDAGTIAFNGALMGSTITAHAAAGMTFDGAVNATGAILAVADAGDITIGAAASLSSGASGNAIVLAASSGNFVNNAGASALTAASGRWLVYASDPAASTFGALASGNVPLWGSTYAGTPPASVAQTGNRYVFAIPRDAYLHLRQPDQDLRR